MKLVTIRLARISSQVVKSVRDTTVSLDAMSRKTIVVLVTFRSLLLLGERQHRQNSTYITIDRENFSRKYLVYGSLLIAMNFLL